MRASSAVKRQSLKDMRVIDGRVAVGHFDVSPALEGSKRDEEVGDAVLCDELL